MIKLLLEESKRLNVDIHSIADDEDEDDPTPLFHTRTSAAVEIFLAAELEGLELADKKSGKPLLHHCILNDILTDSISASLNNQREMEYEGNTAVQLGRNS